MVASGVLTEYEKNHNLDQLMWFYARRDGGGGGGGGGEGEGKQVFNLFDPEAEKRS